MTMKSCFYSNLQGTSAPPWPCPNGYSRLSSAPNGAFVSRAAFKNSRVRNEVIGNQLLWSNNGGMINI